MNRSILAPACAALLVALAMSAPAQAAHSSSTYAQPVWFEWYKTDLDVLVIPPSHGQLVNLQNGVPYLLGGNGVDELNPYTSTYLAAVEDSIAAWRTAWTTASPWLAANLNVNVYVLGRDMVPAAALQDPEIVVSALEETNAYLGVAAIHGVRTIGVPDCVVSNTKTFVYSFTYADLYNVNIHEFGHCLGLDHIHNDDPLHDVMDSIYRYPVGQQSNPLKCISNLNIAGLERAFDGRGGSGTVSRSSYGCV